MAHAGNVILVETAPQVSLRVFHIAPEDSHLLVVELRVPPLLPLVRVRGLLWG